MDTIQIPRQLERLLERIASGIEKLAEEPVIHIEAGPPECPHCHVVNPNVATRDEASSGPLSEFLLQVVCLSCHEGFFAIPETWVSAPNREVAAAEMEKRGQYLERNENGGK